MLIGLMQLGTRCSDGSCEAAEDLISGFSAIEAEAELVQIGLKLCAAAVISAEQECFQVASASRQVHTVSRPAPRQTGSYSFCSRRIRFLHLSQQFCR